MIDRGFIFSFGLLLFLPLLGIAQDVQKLLRDAHSLETKFHEQEALQKYAQVLKVQPGNLRALCKSSELHAMLGRRLPTKEKQENYYYTAKTFAQQALKINPNYPEANFVMAFALGRIALISSGDERINAVKDIRSYSEKTIKLDPTHYKAYHVLARWHYEVSNLNAVERLLLKVAYGSLPASSLESAISNYEKSRQLNPGFLLNYLELAKAYRRKDNTAKAKAYLNNLLKLPLTSSTDLTVKAEARKLLEKWD